MKYLLGAVAGIVAAAVVAWLLFFQSGLRIDLSRTTVVQRIQRLQRLETVVYSMEKVVTGTQDNAYLPRILGGDRILLIVHGEVTAGIDLAKLDTSKIDIKDRGIELDLPPAEVFSARLDNEQTRVYSRETGLFTMPDPNLESEVRREAERQIRQSALDSGILKTAADNGRATLSGFTGLFTFEVDETIDIPRFADLLKFFRLGVSWGGHESLTVPVAASLAQTPGINSFDRFGVSPRAIRLNIGLEDPEKLWADLDNALAKSAKT